MKENKHTIGDLYQMQSLPLEAKIRMTKYRIREWIETFGESGIYIGFSGGKDSTVLLDIVRQDYPNAKAMFVDVPTQYPELRNFVKTYSNVDIVRPKMNFFQVCQRYGFPLISKEVSESVYGARKYLTEIMNQLGFDRQTDRQQPPYKYYYEKITGTGKYSKFLGSLLSVDNESIKNPTRGGVRQKIS